MKNWKTCAVVVVGIIFFALMCVFGVQGSRNKAIGLEEAIETSMSDIKVQEKRRIDLLPNLVDCVKQYDKHEAETLQAIVDGRGSTGDIENVTTAITAVAEAYPELKSNENYKQLMTELATTENMIAQYRESYNKQVGTYNRYVKGFPARQFLSWTGYEVLDYQRLDYQAPVDAPTNLFGE
ncbi:LemA family protein [Enterocloster clostridioformis]|uniref:LemA family protein n=1 Tax=Enterocloster clostridioformis TaxID=1531 RepID=UPI00074081A8|nr:LemA family protein [Enterocloster clostridioformis]MCI7357145.1 LemA family protein [Parabacteroides sp.]CUX74301.1 LemA family protein [Clostridium sp. C105KSO14]